MAIRRGLGQAGPVCQETPSGDLQAEGEEEEGHGSGDLRQELRGGGEEDPPAKYRLRPETLDPVSNLNILCRLKNAHRYKSTVVK